MSYALVMSVSRVKPVRPQCGVRCVVDRGTSLLEAVDHGAGRIDDFERIVAVEVDRAGTTVDVTAEGVVRIRHDEDLAVGELDVRKS